jgi:hypothetical protein
VRNRRCVGISAKTVLCGFGVGLSWGTATLTLAPGTRFEWVETDETYRA